MKKIGRIVKGLFADLVKLRKPVTATAVVATGIEILEPLGIHIDSTKALAVVAGVGLLAGLVEKYANDPA